MNTQFEKRDIYKYTWQHPGSKRWYCINYILMPQTQRKYCHNVSVMRKANCWTDHELLRANIVLQVINSNRQSSRKYRFADYKLSDL